MPQFIASHIPPGLDEFTSGYFEAAEFTDVTRDHGISPDKVRGWSRRAIAEGVASCKAFQEHNREALELYQQETGRDLREAGHDLWYTSNGHGVGLWDRDGKGPGTDACDADARRYPDKSVDCWRGRLYFI
jgi:hypothetical protein